MIEAGQSIDVTSRVLGHADPGTTRRHYDRAALVEARKAAALTQDAAIPDPYATRTDGPEAPKSTIRGRKVKRKAGG
jgi:hypothetical protein